LKNACVLCGSRDWQVILEVEGAEIEKCGGCDLVRTAGFELPSYEKYHRDDDYKNCEGHFKNIFRKRFEIVKRFGRGQRRVLEVGCSTGVMLDVFAREGWECWGVEPSGAGEIAKEKGYKVLRTTFEKAKFPSGRFDAVVLNHTLEHMLDPVAVMKKVRKLLKKGGVVLVDVPNFGSLSRMLTGSSWPFYYPREHAYHFTPDSLRRVFEKSGLEVVCWESRSGIFEYAKPLGEIWFSLLGMKKRFFTDLLGAPGAAIATTLNRGSSFSMVGRK
jgi:SAM-dependent methyltransferase